MKKFRRIAAAAVAAVMVFSLAACGSKDSGVVADTVKELEKLAEEEVTLEGTWKSEPINMVDSFAEGADEEMQKQMGLDLSVKDYVKEFNLQCTLVFSEDDTFQLSYGLATDTDTIRAQFADYMRATFNALAGEELSDETLSEMMGMSLEDYIAQEYSDEAIAESFPENMMTGAYTFENGEVTITDEESGEFSSGTLEGGILTMNDKTLGEIVFTKAE